MPSRRQDLGLAILFTIAGTFTLFFLLTHPATPTSSLLIIIPYFTAAILFLRAMYGHKKKRKQPPDDL
jgi:ABC-type Na+ efflux pump permease subunit